MAKTTATFPIGFILLVIFVTLKLTHVIAWSWLWVLSPIWIPIILWLGFLSLLALIAMCVAIAALFK
jgi:hypothetical protein